MNHKINNKIIISIFISSLLFYASFENADLRNANFSGADMREVYLVGANLEGANLNCINHRICN